MRRALFALTICSLGAWSCDDDDTLGRQPDRLMINTTSLESAVVGTSYSATLIAQGGTEEGYRWSIRDGTLPDALVLAEDGTPSTTISGLPTIGGRFQFTVEVRDSAGTSASQVLAISISDRSRPIDISTVSLPDAEVGVPYEASFEAMHGTGEDIRWSLEAGELPPGLQLSDLDERISRISGTPTEAGLFEFALRVRDSGGSSALRTFVLQVERAIVRELTIITTSLPFAVQGEHYAAELIAFNGEGVHNWSIVQGNLPPGLELEDSNSAINFITGTPSNSGSFNFTVRVSAGGATAERALTLRVIAAPTELTITTEEIPNGRARVPYSALISAFGGNAPFTWDVISGDLPEGLRLAPSPTRNTVLFGTPSDDGLHRFTIRVRDASGASGEKTFQIRIFAAPAQLFITSETLPPATLGIPYSAVIGSVIGVEPLRWTIAEGQLPPGMILGDSPGPQASIAGTPSRAGTFIFTVQVEDAAGARDRQRLQLLVAPPPPVLTIATTFLPQGDVGVPYQATVIAVSGQGALTWRVAAGQLPPGLSLGAGTNGTNEIRGTPAMAGTFLFTLEVRDSTSRVAQRTFIITILAPPPPVPALEIGGGELPGATVGTAYSAMITASGGTTPFTWTIVSGNLPPGLMLGTSTTRTTEISGTPTQAGRFAFTVRVEDSNARSAQKDFVITVSPMAVPEPLMVATSTVASGRVGVPYDQTITAAGGSKRDYRWSVSGGALPPGLTMQAMGTPSTRVSGQPTLAGTFTATITVSDSEGTRASQPFTFTIFEP